MKLIFNSIQKTILELQEHLCKDSHLKRIALLSSLVCGAIKTGSCHIGSLATGLCRDINAKSGETTVSRFLNNKWVRPQDFYIVIIKAFLQIVLTFNNKLVIVIDGSQTGNKHATLMVSFVFRNRGIPLCWLVKEGSKGHFTEDDHIKVLMQANEILKKILPDPFRVIVLGDGEFDGIRLQQLCLGNHWDYIFRTACDSLMYENDDEFRPKNISPAPDNFFFLHHIAFTKKRFIVNFLCWHEKKHKDPLYLISNLDYPKEIAELYKFRTYTECLFKDFKSNHFNLHKTRLENAYAIENLVMVIAIAFVLLLVLGLANENNPIRKKVQVVRNDQKTLSLFIYSLRLLEYLLNRDLPIEFSFQISKNGP